MVPLSKKNCLKDSDNKKIKNYGTFPHILITYRPVVIIFSIRFASRNCQIHRMYNRAMLYNYPSKIFTRVNFWKKITILKPSRFYKNSLCVIRKITLNGSFYTIFILNRKNNQIEYILVFLSQNNIYEFCSACTLKMFMFWHIQDPVTTLQFFLLLKMKVVYIIMFKSKVVSIIMFKSTPESSITRIKYFPDSENQVTTLTWLLKRELFEMKRKRGKKKIGVNWRKKKNFDQLV